MKVENDDLQKLRDILNKYKTYHDSLFEIETKIEEIDESRKNLLKGVDYIKECIEKTTVEESEFKEFMISKYGQFDIFSILESH